MRFHQEGIGSLFDTQQDRQLYYPRQQRGSQVKLLPHIQTMLYLEAYQPKIWSIRRLYLDGAHPG